MAYPTRNTDNYTSPTKNSSSFTIPDVSGLNRLLIDASFFLLIDTDNRLLIENNSSDWSYQSKS